jgi:hypothetical protein
MQSHARPLATQHPAQVAVAAPHIARRAPDTEILPASLFIPVDLPLHSAYPFFVPVARNTRTVYTPREGVNTNCEK